jgi:hypothetical protein
MDRLLHLHWGNRDPLTLPRSVQRLHVENVDTLGLTKDFKTLQTSRLLQIGRDSTRLSTRTEEIGLGLDFC